MGAFRDALDALASLSVTGVRNSCGIAAVPEEIQRGQLPALLALPLERESGGLFVERGDGLQTLAFSGGGTTVEVLVTHLLLVAPASAGSGLRTHLPALVVLIDAYFAALRGDLLLGGALAVPPGVQVQPGLFEYGGATYVGCAFRHRWTLVS
jgi:hypothetical protein